MFGRLLLGRVLGIPIYASGLLLVLGAAVLLMASFGNAALVGLMALLLVSVFLHELGHALVARRLGVRVIDIVLGPLVCSARMVEIPEDPRVESRIAAAGPGVNLLLALLGAPLLLLFQAPVFSETPQTLVLWFVEVNLILGVFNLLPGFPMDGGRLLRSLLARRMGWLGATERAVQVGRALAIGLAVIGLFVFPRAFLLMPLVALYLWFAGTRELWMVRQRHGRSPLTGEPAPAGFGPFAAAFGGAPFGQGPTGGGPAGHPFFGGAAAADDGDATWADESPRDPDPPGSAPNGARRPRTIDVDEIVDQGRERGLSDDLVKKLESFPGRLRRPRR